ncbi:MAG: efflux RND transporter periplasmic adaptor subunit [Sphingomonas fennica]
MTDAAQTDLATFLGAGAHSPRNRWIKRGLIALAGVLLVILLVRLATGGKAVPVWRTEAVTRGDLTVTVSATGNLQPTNQVTVGSELSGLVTQVLVDNNDRVRRGQVLARIDPARFQDTVEQSRAALAAAEAAVGQAEATRQQTRAALNRLQEVYRLSGGKVPSGTELDTGRADYARAVAAVRSAEAQVLQARAQARIDQTQLSRSLILSPVTGVVLSREIEPGQTVAASFNAPTLFVIAEDLARMKLEAKVDEADVGAVKRGQPASFTVDAFPGRRFPAKIARVDVGANTGSSGSTGSSGTTTTTATTSSVVSYTAELSVANGDLALRPGMTATADIVTSARRGVLLVPNAALRFTPPVAGSGGGRGVAGMMLPGPRRQRRGSEPAIGRGSRQTVYVAGADGAARAVEVTVGETNGTQTEVTGQIAAGDRVIVGQQVRGGGDG